jgi:hypothetical protein
MRSYLFLTFLGLLALAVGLFLFLLLHDTSDQSIESKAEWADLQRIESDLHSKPVTEATIVFAGDRSFLEIPGSTSSGFGLVVLLRAKAEPYYKQMPEGTYRLTQRDLAKVTASGVVSSTVLAVLSSHTEPKPFYPAQP